MPLKGEKNRIYMREYMRERRMRQKADQTADPRAADTSKWQAEAGGVRLMTENEGLRAEIFEMKDGFSAWSNVLKCRTGVMTKAEYDSLLLCLHPDSRKSVSDERLDSAFRLLSDLRYVLCNDKQMPFPEKYRPTP